MSLWQGEANLTLVTRQIQTFLAQKVNWKSHNFKIRKTCKRRSRNKLNDLLDLEKQKQVAKNLEPVAIYNLNALIEMSTGCCMEANLTVNYI